MHWHCRGLQDKMYPFVYIWQQYVWRSADDATPAAPNGRVGRRRLSRGAPAEPLAQGRLHLGGNERTTEEGGRPPVTTLRSPKSTPSTDALLDFLSPPVSSTTRSLPLQATTVSLLGSHGLYCRSFTGFGEVCSIPLVARPGTVPSVTSYACVGLPTCALRGWSWQAAWRRPAARLRLLRQRPAARPPWDSRYP